MSEAIVKYTITKPKILLWDVESSYSMGYFFDVWETNISPDNIVIPSYIHCISYRWYGEKKIHTISQIDFPLFKKNIHDDYCVLKEFSKIISQADIFVYHNGDRFDIKKFNARLRLNDLPPVPIVKSYDTYKLAKKYFKFDYNSLDYLAKAFGYHGKTENKSGLWRSCFEGNIDDLKQMARYNRNDIDILEFIFNKIMPFVNIHHIKTNGLKCNNIICGGENIIWKGFKRRKNGRYHEFQCKDCGSYGAEKIKDINP